MTDPLSSLAASPDPAVTQRRASDPDASVWVGASAGTGKTKVLTDRVLRLMLAGTPPHRILCLTFTKAAAAEMANRINHTLSAWVTVTDAELEDQLAELNGTRPDPAQIAAARRLFARVVDCPGGMNIETLHAFCQSLLRRFPLEAGLVPHFEVMDDRTAAERLEQVRDQVLLLARQAPDQPLGQALAELTGSLQAEEFAELTAELTRERGRLTRLFAHHGGLASTLTAVWQHLGLPPDSRDADEVARACQDSNLDYAGLRCACAALATGSEADQNRGRELQFWLDSDHVTRINIFDPYLTLFLTKDERQPRKNLITKAAAAHNKRAKPALTTEAERLAELEVRRRTFGVGMATTALLTFAHALTERYTALKAAQALLDYDDLILGARDLLEQPGVAPWVLFKLDGGLDHILIDEAQDTNPEQWQVVARLADEFFVGESARPAAIERTVFAVGDEKQSIYSFQRADPAEFTRMRQYFAARVATAARRWRHIDLDISFRSTAAVLSTVDAVFAGVIARDGVAGDPTQPIQHRPYRRGQAGRVELWPLVCPDNSETPIPWLPPITAESVRSAPTRLAHAIAETVRCWLAEGERLPARGRALQPGDVLILLRRRTGFVNALVRAFKDRGVPVAGVDRMVLTQQLAVMDLMALAEFLLLPEDDLTLATVLKGPLIDLDEDALYTLAQGRDGSLWQALIQRAGYDPAFRPARRYLGERLAQADFIPPYELFAEIVSTPCPADPVSGRRALLRRLGPEAQDPLDEFLTAALSFERIHPPSLQNFLHWLNADEAEIKRELDQGSKQGGGQVRIMTIHGAKGLQAPVVFLPDTLAMPKQSPRILWPDAELPVPLFAFRRNLENEACAAARARANHRRDQEYRRLLYVALTRAEDRLYICGWQNKQATTPEGCWYQLVAEALRSQTATISLPFDATRLIADGWKGEALRLDQPQIAPPRADATRSARVETLTALPEWAQTPAPLEPRPSRPLTPSRPEGSEPPLRTPLGEDDGARFQRSLLLHRLLQILPDLAPDARPAAARRFLAHPQHGLTPLQQTTMIAETLAVLDHPEFRHLFGPNSRAEVPVVGVIGTHALSGQIDRLAVAGDTVWVIDYKTHRAPPECAADVPPLYWRQMALYRQALAAIYPGKRIRCVLLWTEGPTLMELAPERLERYEYIH